MLRKCKLPAFMYKYQVFDFLKLIHVQLAAGAVLLEALVPVHDLLVREGCLFSEQEVLADKD